MKVYLKNFHKNRLMAILIPMLGMIWSGMLGAAPLVLPYAAKNPADIPPPICRNNTQSVAITLEAKEVVAEIAPGKNAWFWTFNGTVPGPMIRVMEDDTVVITLINNLQNMEPHNIDFHAAMGPGGGAAVTNVMPGETRIFSFKALREGAYIYHCAGEGMPWEHVSYGMYGMIMVEPRGGLPNVDKEFYVGQSEWYLKVDTALNEEMHLPPDTLTLDEEKAMIERPYLYTFNGHKDALTNPVIFGDAMLAHQNDKVRIFMVTGGPNKGSNFHIIGTIFNKVYTGYSKDYTRNEETVYVAPGSAAVFELITPVPGQYLLVDHALWRVPQGAGGFLHVMGDPSPACNSSGVITNPGSWPFYIYSPAACSSGH